MKHGGDLSEAIAYYGGVFQDWLDLSSGINPEPWPLDTHLAAQALHRLPGHCGEAVLAGAARRFYQAAPEAGIVAAPGTQALIQWLPHLASEGEVAILGPTYSEHAASWRRAGRNVIETGEIKSLPQSIRHVVLVNPNNPDGHIFGRTALVSLAEEVKRRGGWLVLDESFADTDPGISCAGLCADLPFVVLRSFGKFFGLPGLRLGFLIAPSAVAALFQAALGPWAVSTLALNIGAHALNDHAWAENARVRLAKMAKALDGVLDAAGFNIIGGTSLFRLAHHADARALHDRLARRHIWCRRFEDHQDRLRFGLPRHAQDLARLKETLLSS